MLGKIAGRRRRGQQRMRWLDGITDLMDVILVMKVQNTFYVICGMSLFVHSLSTRQIMRSMELSVIYAWHFSKDFISILSSRPHESSLG